MKKIKKGIDESLKLTDAERLVISSRLKEVREDNKLNMGDMGRVCHVTVATYSRYEAGQVDNIPVPRIVAIGRHFGVNPAWIMGWSEKKNRNGVE